MINALKGFYLKYRVYILLFLFVFVGLELINHFIVEKLNVSPHQVSTSIDSSQAPLLFEKSNGTGISGAVPQKWIVWLPFALLVALSTIIYLFQRWKGIDRFFPGFVLLRAGVVGNRRSGYLKWRIVVSNRKSESITFSEPVMVFAKFSDKKRYKVRSEDYPIVLSSKTNHALTIELNQFYQRVPELTKYRFVRTEIHASNGKVYRSFWRVIAVRMR